MGEFSPGIGEQHDAQQGSNAAPLYDSTSQPLKDSVYNEKEGLRNIYSFLTQQIPFEALSTVPVNLLQKQPRSRKGTSYGLYIGKRESISTTLIYNLEPDVVEKAKGQFFLVPNEFTTQNGYKYFWLDVRSNKADHYEDEDLPLESTRLNPGSSSRLIDTRGWHNIGEALLRDYIFQENEVEFEDLKPFYTIFDSKQGYRIASEGQLEIVIRDNPVLRNGDKVKFQIKRDAIKKIEWLEVYKVISDKPEEEWPLAFSQRILRNEKKITPRKWFGPEKQFFNDFFYGNNDINFSDLVPYKTKVLPSRTETLFNIVGRSEWINIPPSANVGDEIVFIPREDEQSLYQWIDVYRIDPETGKQSREPITSKRIINRSIDRSNWLGYERQLIFDYASGILQFDNLRPIKSTLGKTQRITLWSEGNEKKIVNADHKTDLKEGDNVILVPEKEENGILTMVLVKDGEVYIKYSYNKETRQFTTEEVVKTNLSNEKFTIFNNELGRLIDVDGKRWVNMDWIIRTYSRDRPRVLPLLQSIPIKVYQYRRGREAFLYSEEDVMKVLAENGINIPQDNERDDTNIQDFTDTVVNISEGKSVEAQELRQLIGLFGGSSAVDILFHHHPQFKGLPIDYVRSTLGEYLGDFMVVKQPFKPEDLSVTQEYLSDLNLQDALFEVIKTSCLDEFNKIRRANTDANPKQVIGDYVQSISQKATELSSGELEQIVGRVREYYASLFGDFEKPSHLVDRLSGERIFPDINQLINIKELHDKKKLLIADGMGLGKSASVILFKEIQGLSTALIITPSNVVSTWKRYLSDQEDGYFKPGEAPRVLVIEDLDTLQESNISDFDYVLISHEKMSPHYVDILEQQRFGITIVDEIHKLKNLKEGKRTQELLRLAANVEEKDQYMALLSGTPVPNKVEDVAMILRLLYPDLVKSMDDKSLNTNIINGDLIDLRSLLLPRMQKKEISESLNLPNLEEITIHSQLSEIEQQIYEVLLEEDEMTANMKLQVLRQFLMNPDLIDITPGITSTKISRVSSELTKDFQEHNSIIIFANGYVEGILRGENSLLDKLSITEEVEVYVIEGNVAQKERDRIVQEMKANGKKFLLLVSGQTADVGVDFSFADGVYEYNEPWTQYEKDQQIARVYRQGVRHDIKSKTFITDGTIEEGIHEYIQAKKTAIEKLLRGIPLSEMEQELVRKAEEQADPNLEVNPELAEYYFSVWNKMKKIFSYVKEIGEEDFKKFLEKYGTDYAEGYREMGRRSYQANASRVSGTLLHEMVIERGQVAGDLSVLDIASGPEMLRKHSHDNFQSNIHSLDLNPHHFALSIDEMHKVGSFLEMPYEDASFDYANMSLAFHYTQGRNERVQLLMESNRVLKSGGRLILNNMNSLDIKNMDSFKEIVSLLGFKVVDDYTGRISVDRNYQSEVITLEKVAYYPTDSASIIEAIGKENFDGLKLRKNASVLKDSRRIISSFALNGRNYNVHFNNEDRQVRDEERHVIHEGERLKTEYGSIKEIPVNEIIGHDFIRVFLNGKYILFKPLQSASGVIIVK